jgi:hypothetical protein
MARADLLLGLMLAITAVAFAHGNEEHVVGTVNKVSSDTVTVQTADGRIAKVTYTAETKFIKSGSPSSARDLHEGDRTIKCVSAIRVEFHSVTNCTTRRCFTF